MVIIEQSSIYIVKYYYPGDKVLSPQWLLCGEFADQNQALERSIYLQNNGMSNVKIEKKTSFSSESCQCLDDGIY